MGYQLAAFSLSMSLIFVTCNSLEVQKATESKPDFSIKLIRQNSDTILVRYLRDTDSSSIFISGIFQDEVINCDSCLLVLGDADKKVVPYYKVNDSLFLLPVLGTNWRILLYILDFKSEKNLQPYNGGRQYIETYSEQFIYDASQRTITVEPEPEYDKKLNIVKSPKDIYIFKDTAFVLQK